MEQLQKQITGAKSVGAQAVGMLLREIGRHSRPAAELIEQDLQNAEMGIEKCYAALERYAQKHAQGSCWACPVIGIDTENEAVKVILDFYHIPADWLNAPKAQTLGREAAGKSLDLMSLI